MDQVKKYSREWFVTQNNIARTNAAKNVKNNVFSGDYLKYWTANNEEFVGSKEELRQKFNERLNNIDESDIFSVENLIQSYGGLDAILDLLDEDCDGNITAEEIAKIAAADTSEFADELDTSFSAYDLYTITKNAEAAEGATVVTKDGNLKFEYKDGSVTELQQDSDGNILEKVIKTTKFNELETEIYDYRSKIKYDTIEDSQGRIRYASVDAPGRVNDSVKNTQYNPDKTRVLVEETAGTKTTKKYSATGKQISSKKEFTYGTVNGKIDEKVEQQDIGDCWVLAGLVSLQGTTEGAKIISQSIQKNSDGSVTVKLKGVNKQYKFTADQIGAAEYANINKSFSEGDTDMRLFEMAIQKYREDLITNGGATRNSFLTNATMQDPLKTGYLEEAIYYLTGKEHTEAYKIEDYTKGLDAKLASPKNTAISVNFKETDLSFGTDKIVNKHAYTVDSVTQDTVYVINPWDTSEKIAYPKDKFLENCNYMITFDLTPATTTTKK